MARLRLSRMILPAVFPLALLVAPARAATPPGDPAPPFGEERFVMPEAASPAAEAARAATEARRAAAAAQAVGPAFNMELVGHWDPGTSVINADIWAHAGFAYMGTANRGCTGQGVRISDVSDPTNPTHVATIAAGQGRSAEDIVVRKVNTRSFRGDLLAVGIQDCSGPREPQHSGVELYDVTDPRHPVFLSFFGVSVDGFIGGPAGVHELDMFERGNRVFALLAVPFSEVQHPQGLGDFRILDVTDPRNPVQLAHWGVLENLGLDPGSGQGCSRSRFDHSVVASQDGTRAYLSYWDAGMIILDITEPDRPVFLGRTLYPDDADGDTHSVHITRGGTLALAQDEDFCFNVANEGQPRSWGFLRIFDLTDPGNPVQVATFATPNASNPPPVGRFSAHNSVVHGQTAYLSWYSDGIRALNIADLDNIREIGFFVPPPGPGRGGLATSTQVWGVHALNTPGHGVLVYASDLLSGLWIVRLTHNE